MNRSFVFAAILIAALLGAGPAPADERPFYFTAPAGNLPTQIDKKQELFILPNGRLLTPWAKQFMLPPHPYGLAISTDFFTTEPDVTPYSVRESDRRVFDPDAITPARSIYKYMQGDPLDDPETIEAEHWQQLKQANTNVNKPE